MGVHFTFDGKTYVQKNGVALGSPLGLALSGIFMVELENHLIQTVSEHLACWKRYIFICQHNLHMKQKIINPSHS